MFSVDVYILVCWDLIKFYTLIKKERYMRAANKNETLKKKVLLESFQIEKELSIKQMIMIKLQGRLYITISKD